MIVERITSQGEVAGILALEDPRLEKQVLKKLDCTKAEWVQAINNFLPNQSFLGMWAVKEDRKIMAYIVAVNGVAPPISRSVMILYQSFFGMKDEEGGLVLSQALEAVKTWARECGARNIAIHTDKPHINSQFGFIAEKGVSMVLEL